MERIISNSQDKRRCTKNASDVRQDQEVGETEGRDLQTHSPQTPRVTESFRISRNDGI